MNKVESSKRIVSNDDDFQIIDLGIGTPDFDTPVHIKEAAKVAIDEGFVTYTNPRGFFDLREAIAQKLHTDNDLDYDPETEIIVTVGAKNAIYNAIQATINPGEQVIVTDPCFQHYYSIVRSANAFPVSIPLDEEHNFRIKSEKIRKCITSKTKMILINSPHNPTGSVLTKNDIENIADVAIDYNLMVLSDEIYEKIVYDEVEHYSIAALPGMKDRTITVNGFSKTYAMTGWRIGYAAAKEEVIEKMSKIALSSVTCACSFAQKGAIAALSCPQEIIDEMVMEYKKRRDFIIEKLRKIKGITCKTPKGAFYAFPNISKFGKTSNEIAEILLKKAKVRTTSGSVYGKNGEGYLRITYSNSMESLREALERMQKTLQY